MIMPDFNSYTNNSVNKYISNGTWMYPYPSYITEYYYNGFCCEPYSGLYCSLYNVSHKMVKICIFIKFLV